MTFTDIVKKVLRDLELSEEQIDRMYLNAMVKTPIQGCKRSVFTAGGATSVPAPSVWTFIT